TTLFRSTAHTSDDGTGNCSTTATLGSPTVSDNCSTPANITVSNDAPATFPKGDTTVTWTAKDESGNTQTCTQKVTVLVDEKPSILCPADVTAHTSDDGTGNCSSSEAHT